MSASTDIFETITAKVVKTIESGNAGKWSKPWTQVLAANGMHSNVLTKAEYQGFNQFILMLTGAVEGYTLPLWATYKQFETLGGQVRKGETGTQLVKWGVNYRCTACNHKGRIACLKPDHLSEERWFASAFTVFNVAQQDGFEVEVPDLGSEPERIAALEAMIEASGADINYALSNEAFFNRVTDQITLPLREQFETPSAFYGTALHELTHWTGHESRLDRTMGKRFGDNAYAAEELVAELGATFLAARFGVDTDPHPEHVNYLASWLKVLKADSKALYTAAKLAQESTHYLEAKDTSASSAA